MKKAILLLALFAAAFMSACEQERNFDLPSTELTFGQSLIRNGQVDILWVVDTSQSMEQHQQQLSEQVSPFLDFITDKRRGINFNMASITMDMGFGGDGGKFIGSPKYLTNDTPNLKSEFLKKIVLGAGGGNVEIALESLQAFVEGEGNPQWSDFLREGAPLIVIFLTNEDDQSAGEVSDYVTLLDELRPKLESGQRGWTAHLLGVLDLDGECRTRYSYADPSHRLIALSEASQGKQGTICTTDFRSILSNIRAQIVSQLTDFEVPREPLVETVHIEIERFREVTWGETEFVSRETVPQSAQDGWTYIPGLKVFRFHGSAIPGEFDRVLVKYKPARPD